MWLHLPEISDIPLDHAKASYSTISFFVDTSEITPSPVNLTLKAGPVASTQGSFGSQSFVFSISEDITVPVVNGIANFTNIPIYEGTLLTSNFTYSSRNPNQKYILPNSGIDTALLRVTVQSSQSSTQKVKYSAQDDLFELGSSSKVYFLQEIENERYELFFGDGVFGQALEEGNYITANYIVSNGDSANGVSQFSYSGRITYTRNSIEYTVTSGISLLNTGIISTGGESIESVESIKKFAPKVYASQNRVLTANDYESLIPTKIYPETESISVFGGEELVPPQYGKVFISIKPRTGDFLPNLTKENIKMKLKKYAVAGIVPEILDLKYLFIEVDTKVYYNTNFASSSAAVSTIVQTNANKYSESTELNRYGARFKYSKFLKIIDDSSDAITSNITTVNMRRDLRVALNAFAEYSIGFGNAMHVKDPDGYNIKTSAFRIVGINEPVYLSDLPNTDRLSGSLFLFTLPSVNSNSPTIVRRNVGKIDYQRGIITLNPINIISGKIKDGQTIIEIAASPSSNDVVGLQDLYLQLDITNSNFEPVVDDIASGLDPSASTYTVSSSYPNGTLVRSGGRDEVSTTTTQSGGFQTTIATGTGAAAATSTGGVTGGSTGSTSSAPTTPSAPSGGSSGGGSGGGGGGGGYGY